MTPRRQAGFTLIEVIIAIMIMAIISLISWRAIDSVALTSRKLDQHTDDALALQRAFDQFERDVAARSLVLAEP
ncbi:PulJ/GspJ family protein, partial [Achromobacter insuavis]|uniref:PulJ/GspJ family protein n=2 Tax=Alcaligenaceae TaxID=506 RepID=UPI001F12EB5A